MKIVITAVIILSIYLFVFMLFWGSGQALPLEKVERRLSVDQPLADICPQLGMPPNCCGLIQSTADTYYCELSKIGIGSMVSPQHSIRLIFGLDSRLKSAHMTVEFRAEEQSLPLTLAGSQSK